MKHVLKAPDNLANKARIEAAFGKKADIPKILANVKQMRKGTMKIKSAIPAPEDKGYYGESVPARDAHGNDIIKGNRVTYQHVKLASDFHAAGFSNDDRAGTLIHEAAHVFAGAEDDVVGPKSSDPDLQFSLTMDNHGIQINNPQHKLGPDAKVWEQEGCT